MTRAIEIIVLHTTRFGENSIVVHTLSKEYGRRSFLVRGADRKSVMTLLQPLAILEADVTESTKSSLYTARTLTTRYPLLGIRNSIYKNTMTMFMSEALYRIVKDGTKEDGLFEWCVKDILLLDALQSDFSNFHIRFLLELCIALGFSPETSDIMPFTREHSHLVERFLKEGFADSMMIPLSGNIRNEIAEGILRYIEYHVESGVNIASLRVLRELYS